MKLLIIDDQISVLKGIENGISFAEIGIDQVFTATCADRARDILLHNDIQLVLCDIEMPGENGLELNRWILKNMPHIVRILLTSHADFSYARESLRLCCFDYIVQPAPYDEIEACLKRAAIKLETDKNRERLYQYGVLYESHKPEMSDRIVMNLFSGNTENVKQSLTTLSQMGYALQQCSLIQLIILDIFSYKSSADSVLFDISIRHSLFNSLHQSGITAPAEALITFNRYRQFVILLYCNDETILHYTREKYTAFFKAITATLTEKIACYVGEYSVFHKIRDEVRKIHDVITDNVGKKPGLYMIKELEAHQDYLDITENTARWERMLKNNQLDGFRDNVLSYLDFITAVNKTSFKSLCDLHQQITQILFNYAYNNNIDIIDLFTQDYQYHDYMDGFKDVDCLRKSISFLTGKLQNALSQKLPQSDVQKAKIYIMEHLSQNLSVKDVADYVHLSPEYFTKLFKKETGRNIKDYILQVKVDVAKDLLENPNIPISLVSLELGYSNFSHFTQIFKKIENVTPSEYRKIKLHK